jgi:hypothetical protein
MRWVSFLSILCTLYSYSAGASEAEDKALQAALIQTGLADDLAKAEAWGRVYLVKLGIASYLTTAFALKRIVETQTLTIPIERKTLILTPTSVTATIQIPI